MCNRILILLVSTFIVFAVTGCNESHELQNPSSSTPVTSSYEEDDSMDGTTKAIQHVKNLQANSKAKIMKSYASRHVSYSVGTEDEMSDFKSIFADMKLSSPSNESGAMDGSQSYIIQVGEGEDLCTMMIVVSKEMRISATSEENAMWYCVENRAEIEEQLANLLGKLTSVQT